MKMLRVPAALAAVLLLGFVVARTVQASTPPTIPPAPRDEFDLVVPIRILDVCFTVTQGPNVSDLVELGTDATGPYYGIWYMPLGFANPVLLCYRPRGLVANTVAQFGDGGIQAVELFRKYYERWRRAQTVPGGPPAIFNPTPLQFDHWWPACIFCGPNGGPNTCPIMQMVITAEEWAIGPYVRILCDPLTWVFEDYNFEYKPI